MLYKSNIENENCVFHKNLISIPCMKRFNMVLVSGCCVYIAVEWFRISIIEWVADLCGAMVKKRPADKNAISRITFWAWLI